ncbi:MAG: right-handed parallel beta-helix repeat-containing protein [Pseudomonadota bacterium]
MTRDGKRPKSYKKTDIPKTIHIEKGVIYFQDLVQSSDNIMEENDYYAVRRPISIGIDASLIIKNIEKPIYLMQDEGAFIAYTGQLFILNSTILGWNEKIQKPATLNEDYKNFRPFITAWNGSQTFFANSHFKHLGYNAPKSYGTTLSTQPFIEEMLNEDNLKAPEGQILNSSFEDFYFGFYSHEADNVVIIGNDYRDNIIYAIDPHDWSKNLIIAQNRVSGTKIKHGIILSRHVTDSYVLNNIVTHNVGSGIMLDRQSGNNVIAHNQIEFNQGDGITLYESSDNFLLSNVIKNNRVGVRIRNSQNNIIAGGEVSLNSHQAFMIYKDDLKNTNRDFKKDIFIEQVSVKISDIVTESNLSLMKTNGFDEIALSNINWRKSSLKKDYFQGDIRQFEKQITKALEENNSIQLKSN